MTSTHRNTWKAFERKIAKDIGSERTPLSGGNSKHTRSDTLHPRLYIECKLSQKFTRDILDFEDDIKKAEIEKKIPIRVMRRKGKHGDFAMLQWDDLLFLMKIQGWVKGGF